MRAGQIERLHRRPGDEAELLPARWRRPRTPPHRDRPGWRAGRRSGSASRTAATSRYGPRWRSVSARVGIVEPVRAVLGGEPEDELVDDAPFGVEHEAEGQDRRDRRHRPGQDEQNREPADPAALMRRRSRTGAARGPSSGSRRRCRKTACCRWRGRRSDRRTARHSSAGSRASQNAVGHRVEDEEQEDEDIGRDQEDQPRRSCHGDHLLAPRPESDGARLFDGECRHRTSISSDLELPREVPAAGRHGTLGTACRASRRRP